MNGLQIVNVRPPDFIFAESWREAIDALHFGLLELGIDAPVRENHLEPGTPALLFGAHHLAPASAQQLPADTILYNFEQLREGYPWYREPYLSLLRRHRVWDFSAHNVEHLRRGGIAPAARHVPVGYVPQLERVARTDEDVDVLFFGIVTERRQRVLDALAHAGLKVVALRGVFGAERDLWIARARIVLNLRHTEGGLFESLRVLYLLANRKAVVTEAPAAGELDAEFENGLLATPYEGLVQACAQLAADPDRRATVAARGYAVVTAPHLRMAETLRALPELSPYIMSN